MTLNESWMYHTPEPTGNPWIDVDPAMDVLYKFGVPPANGDAILSVDDKINAEWVQQVGVYEPTVHMGNKPTDNMAGGFGMVNGLPLHWMLGKTSEDSSVFTISPLDGSKRKPRIATRQLIDDVVYNRYGVTMGNLAIDYVDNMLWAKCGWMGMKDAISEAASVTPTLPSDVGNAYNVLYSMSWNSEPLFPTTFRTNIAQKITGFMGSNGYYEEISEFSPFNSICAFQFLSNEAQDASMPSDYQSKQERPFSWTVKKSSDSSQYITCNGTGYLIDQNILKGQGLQTIYMYNIWITNLVFTVKDGLNKTTFYGIA